MNKNVTENRNLYVGGSDIPVIFGLSKYKTRYELLLEKLYNNSQDISSPYIDYGNAMEPKIRDFINKEYNYKFVEDSHINYEKKIRCNVDGVDIEKATILEVKTTTKYKEDNMVYLAQLYLYMREHNCDLGLLVIYNTPDDFKENEVLDPTRLVLKEYKLEDLKNVFFDGIDIYEVISKFWHDYDILLQYNDLGEELSQELIISENIVDVIDYVVSLEDRLKKIKEVENEIKSQKKVLYELMEKENIKTFRTINGIKITRVLPSLKKSTKIDNKTLEEKYPDIYEEIAKVENKRTDGYIKITIPKEK